MFVRVRPPDVNDKSRQQMGAEQVQALRRLTFSSAQTLGVPVDNYSHGSTHNYSSTVLSQMDLSLFKYELFTCDHVIQDTAQQEDVWPHVAFVRESVCEGTDVCICAYGATGSGKTHTMYGPEADVAKLDAYAKQYCTFERLSECPPTVSSANGTSQ